MYTALKKYRVLKRLTQKQVAEHAGLQESVYQRYEYGWSTPNVRTAIRIAEILGTDVNRLWGESPTSQATPSV